MRHQDFNANWLFEYARHEDWVRRAVRGQGRPVDLPHDFRIALEPDPASPGGTNEAFYPDGMGYYEKRFHVDAQAAASPCCLYFDGVYRLCEVRVNNQMLTLHKSGYSPFVVWLTGRLHEGENTVQLRVNAGPLPASRWYPGAGVYRGVELLSAAAPAYILPDGLWLDTISLTEKGASLRLNAEVSPEAGRVRFYLTDGDETLLDVEAEAQGGQACAEVTLSPCRPWSAEDPHLYRLRAEVLGPKGEVLDAEEVPCGVRTVAVNAEQGLLINGRPVKLKGGCIHHDNGLLGAASHRGAEYRKARLMKENGFNAVRCAHDPHSASFLRACDALGLYVMDEAFDAWREGKRAADEHLYFEETWEQQLEAMVRRDRRHACVILWSTGNEVQERSGMSDGAAWSTRLAEKVRSLDRTRPVTNAICGFFEETELQEMALNTMSTLEEGEGKDYWAMKSEDYLAPLDVCGYNYLLDRYEKDHGLFPARVFVGTESFPMEAAENWRAVEKHPYLIGDFVWTAWDYIGEAGIGRSWYGSEESPCGYPWRLAYCGDLDLTGRKRPQSHYRDFLWTDRTRPFLGVQHPSRFGQKEYTTRWGWPDLLECWTYPGFGGKPAAVTVYAREGVVRLILNGETLDEQPVREHRAAFTVSYAPGVLEAVSLDEQGRELGRCALRTAGTPARLILRAEDKNMPGTKLRYVHIELRDEKGVLCPGERRVFVSTQGCRLLGLGSANPCTTDSYAAADCALWRGRALAVLRRESSHPLLTVRTEGLPETSLLL